MTVMAVIVAVRGCVSAPEPAPVAIEAPAPRVPPGMRGILVPSPGSVDVGDRVDVAFGGERWTDREVIGATVDGIVVVGTPDEAVQAGNLWSHPDLRVRVR